MVPISEEQITSVEPLQQAVVVHVLARELRKTEVDQVCAAVDAARVAAPTLPFILDMSKVRFVPSLAMGVLVGLAREFKGRGQRLIFAAMQPDVKQSFTISHLHKMLEIVDDVVQALASTAG